MSRAIFFLSRTFSKPPTNLCVENRRVGYCNYRFDMISVFKHLNSNGSHQFHHQQHSRSFSSILNCQERTSILQRHLFPTPIEISKQSFSLKESYDSALVTHSSFFQWISESTVVEYAQYFIVRFHDWSCLPWWTSIIITTFIVRSVIVFPLALYQNYVIAKLENAKLEMDEIVNNIKYDLNREVRKNKWSQKEAKRIFRMKVRKEWTKLIERDNCHPVKVSILAIFQIPTWVVLSTAFRNLVNKLPNNDTFAEIKFLELSVGGVAWFPDLTVPDSFLLPIALGLLNLTIIEIQSSMHRGERSKIQKVATNIFRGFAILMIPVAACVPSCLTLYWASSSTFGLIQNLAILSPRVRRSVGIPLTRTSHTHPYAHLADQIRNKFRRG